MPRAAANNLNSEQPQERSVLNRITDGLLALNRDWRITYCNQIAVAMLHNSESPCDNLLGEPFSEAFPDIADSVLHEELRRIFEAGTSARFEMQGPEAGRWLEVRTYPAEDGLSVLLIDATERKRSELKLRESDHLLHTILDDSTDAIYVKDMESRFVLINPAGSVLIGRPVDQIIGRTNAEWYSPETASKFRADDSLVMASGHTQTFEEVGASPGITRTYLSTKLPYRDLDGNVVGIVGFTRDISDRKAAEGELEAAHEELRAIVAAAPVAIVSLDTHGYVTGWNPKAERMFGWTSDEIIGQLPLFVPDVAQYEYHRRLQRAAQESIFTDLEVKRVRKDGTEIETSLSLAALHNPAGAVVGFVGILADITRRKQAEAKVLALNEELNERVKQRTAELQRANQELETTNRELETANRELDSFSSSVSHDLRTPLTIISGYSDSLLHHFSAQIDETGINHLNLIIGATERMTRLIDALLSLSRLSRVELQMETVDLSALCRVAIDDLRQVDPDRLVEVSMEDTMIVEGDPRLLGAMMDNLIRNAWKFTRKAECPTIEVWSRQDEGRRVFCVRDNGAGFESEHADRLFTPFQRLHSAREFEGTGIGLATVQRIVERHGGQIWGEGKVNEGAAFYFTLRGSVMPGSGEGASG